MPGRAVAGGGGGGQFGRLTLTVYTPKKIIRKVAEWIGYCIIMIEKSTSQKSQNNVKFT